jgi:hypothetical protein
MKHPTQFLDAAKGIVPGWRTRKVGTVLGDISTSEIF